MRFSFHILFIAFILFPFGNIRAQKDTSINFSAPLHIPLFLAGNFGEIRGGHFHAGIDIKTQQEEGFPVLAAADGYISRVKISLGGYGNALYITHANGYTTAYGHLQRFNKEINDLIIPFQYQEKKFTIEKFFSAVTIPVKKGDTIGVSGNSGGSGGPHLHFEIRKNGIPQNPLKFGFDIKDNIQPTIKNVGIYPMNDTSYINGQNTPLMLSVKKVGSRYILNTTNSLKGRGVLAFGVEAIDKLNGSNNRCGVYNISLRADSQLIYSHQMDQISFENTRFIQTHVDFYQAKKNKRRIQKSYLNSYNKLKIYQNIKNKGFVYFSKYGHQMNYDIVDVYDNKSALDFYVAFDSNTYETEDKLEQHTFFPYTENNHYENEELTVTIPSYSLYEDLKFKTSTKDTITEGVSKVHYVQNLFTPLQKKMTISIRCVENDSLGSKYYAISLNEKLKMISPEGGKYTKGWVTFRTRSMGPYTVLLDTIAPTIKPVNFSNSTTTFNNLNQIVLKVNDTSSGVKN
jgi:hypothetical protein